ncbi:glycoside hydrolase family 1 protein [Candidatus Parcubacteria bacterium]|nr:glycoside hydrolase family 1 protein [Patescibacteria group bacterium]MBU4309820.1 glycoside hydrolase family 1 protein [Patescibacteria group bacterium]MBU4432232.1 glycoside hydrolase family 1 protein [Patescibacteria group bacterium]MBU4578159.1 glycoside hydrolase family 1 protein [Patescibacteria group bacterium]MCG2696696.1 glycoside hydrolase family 1 protein [Candidatus Parcubacteria bacterium]
MPEEDKVIPSVKVETDKEEKIETSSQLSNQVDDRLLSIPAGVSGEFQFPEGFLWGTSTSSYQIEGGVTNDWSEWESSEKRKTFLESKKLKKEDYSCGSACNFWTHYGDDFDLAKNLNTNAIRFGIEWARIETENDVWDVEAVKKYREIFEQARLRGFRIVLTIWHWTNPTWFAAEGGWAGKNAVMYFDRYSAFVVKEFGGYIDYWVTLNEPMVHIANGYLSGKFPPNRHNIFKARKAFNNLVKGHKRAYKNIHLLFPKAKVGITGLINDFEPALKWGPLNNLLAKVFHYFWNHRFLKRIKKYMDYVGLDYYFHDRIICYPPFKKNKNERMTDMGWEIYPKGIYNVLKYLRRFRKPIIVMENGLADEHDKYRAAFIKEHLYWVHRAIQEGIDVRGYFHWSLLDNFEWADGFGPKFGLYTVDRKTFERKIKPSAFVYKRICEENKLTL